MAVFADEQAAVPIFFNSTFKCSIVMAKDKNELDVKCECSALTAAK